MSSARRPRPTPKPLRSWQGLLCDRSVFSVDGCHTTGLVRDRPAAVSGCRTLRQLAAAFFRQKHIAPGYLAVPPPSMHSSMPVMKLASSLARNSTPLATSMGLARRPIGQLAMIKSIASLGNSRFNSGVSAPPGWIRVHADAVADMGDCRTLRHVTDRCLDRLVGERDGGRAYTPNRGQVDDRAGVLLDHVRIRLPSSRGTCRSGGV